MIKHPKLDWSNVKHCHEYKTNLENLQNELLNVSINSIDTKDVAIDQANKLCNNVISTLHKAVDKTIADNQSRYKGKYLKKHWWSNDCLISRDRQRFWFRIWISCDRPREGHIFECYKLAKKTYRKACRMAVNSLSINRIIKLNYYQRQKDSKKLWNLIRRNKINKASSDNSDDIKMESLFNFY